MKYARILGSLAVCGLVAAGIPALADDEKKKDAKTVEAAEAPAVGVPALKQRVADLRQIAKEMKSSGNDKASKKVHVVADALEQDILAIEKAGLFKKETKKGFEDGKSKDGDGASDGRLGNQGRGVGHGKPSEPGTGKPDTVGEPDKEHKDTKDKDKKDA